MSGKTRIEWADRVWNPVVGCTPVSAGCAHCYAKRIYERFSKGKPFNQVQLYPERLEEIYHWRKPRRIFVNSMGDLFHEDVPDEFIWYVFDNMTRGNRRHTYVILTKRPERMKAWFEKYQEKFWHYHAPNEPHGQYVAAPWPDPCIWLGVTVENQKAADERIPLLLETPAAVRFVSVEPMLGPVDLWKFAQCEETFGSMFDCRGTYDYAQDAGFPNHPVKVIEGLDWVICGGETGPGARPMHPGWVRDLRDQCQAADVPFFFKSWGEYTSTFTTGVSFVVPDVGKVYFRVGKKAAGRMIDGQEWNEFPEVGR